MSNRPCIFSSKAQTMPVWLPCCGSWHSIMPKTLTISSWSDWHRWVERQKAPSIRQKYIPVLNTPDVWVIIHYLLFVLLQGLTHLGKGTLTLCPYHSDRQLMSQVAVAGLLTVLVSFLDVKNSQSIFLVLPLHFITQNWLLFFFYLAFTT